ncbi:MAG: hypoxanthine phosphoribosyltransferase [Clostridia bacterium]|nr:hypoxanthine phosphoribosyltransferase [Clostridia bacterium]
MHQDLKEILLTQQQLADKTKELAQRISNDYRGKEFVMVTVLKGGFIFASDLVRQMDIDVDINFMAVSSYGSGTRSNGNVKIVKDLDSDIRGKHVLIVEDIVDSGHTLSFLMRLMKDRGAVDVKICTILNKPSRREVDIDVAYLGYDIPDEFVVGYGLDYDERYRNLPYLGTLKEEVYNS